MNRNVDVFVTGIHVRDGEPTEKVESTNLGIYRHLEDGSHLVEYDENQDMGAGMKVHNRVQIGADLRNMEIEREGSTNSHLSFGNNMVYDTEYSTPYGSMHMKVRTSSFDCSERGDSEIKVVAEYDLMIDDNLVSRSMIVIDIKNAETA